MSDFIGVIRNAGTGQIYAVINPDDDAELDNPRLLLLKAVGRSEAIEMVRVPRDEYMKTTTREELEALVETLT